MRFAVAWGRKTGAERSTRIESNQVIQNHLVKNESDWRFESSCCHRGVGPHWKYQDVQRYGAVVAKLAPRLGE